MKVLHSKTFFYEFNFVLFLTNTAIKKILKLRCFFLGILPRASVVDINHHT
ncbi:hypothetical protein H1P_2650005 [Hyella patelloides LEGE 07179]|uniref:Uncharacterized protein n=1 Tax=Hyella patelloides LEGE 07179 TaxID=945734 RepID=A0A563VSK0_9CYAN|nr:hypothetical protein H1P_2650005 [Hyella patelloides LEGE 07179]